jgi:S1-C subfamily serine protease
VAASCIHCHQVGEAIRSELRDEGKPIPTAMLFPYPNPKVLGIVMDPKQRATVVSLADNSAGAKAGLKAGDELVSIAGQPILSTADIQWALHNAPESGLIEVGIRRAGQPRQQTLELEPGWRTRDDVSWRANSWSLRRMTLGGLKLEEASAELGQQLQLDDTSMALVVKHMGQHGDNAHAKQQGFKVGDVILSMAGNSRRMRETDLFALLIDKPVGERIPVKVWRDAKQLEFSLAMQK